MIKGLDVFRSEWGHQNPLSAALSGLEIEAVEVLDIGVFFWYYYEPLCWLIYASPQ